MMKINREYKTWLKGNVGYSRYCLQALQKYDQSLFKIKWEYKDFHRNAAKQICFSITVYCNKAKNITMGGFIKIGSQASINFMLLWCTPVELNPYDTLTEFRKAFISVVYYANFRQ